MFRKKDRENIDNLNRFVVDLSKKVEGLRLVLNVTRSEIEQTNTHLDDVEAIAKDHVNAAAELGSRIQDITLVVDRIDDDVEDLRIDVVKLDNKHDDTVENFAALVDNLGKTETENEPLSEEESTIIRKTMIQCQACRGYHWFGICPRMKASHIERNAAGVPIVEDYTYHDPGAGWEKDIINVEDLFPAPEEEEEVIEPEDVPSITEDITAYRPAGRRPRIPKTLRVDDDASE